MGIAIGLGKEIIVTGELGDNGTWHHHKAVTISDKSVEEVMSYVYYG
jgi:hypothetical protein